MEYIAEIPCPNCGRMLGLMECENVPEENVFHWSLCVSCYAPFVVTITDDGVSIRLMTDSEFRELFQEYLEKRATIALARKTYLRIMELQINGRFN